MVQVLFLLYLNQEWISLNSYIEIKLNNMMLSLHHLCQATANNAMVFDNGVNDTT